LSNKDNFITSYKQSPLFTYSKKTSPQKIIDNLNEEIDLTPWTFSKTVQALSGKQTPYQSVEQKQIKIIQKSWDYNPEGIVSKTKDMI